MLRRLNYEHVKQYFIDKKCELLENTYINARTKMKYRCKCGNIAYIDFDHFTRNRYCIKCQPQRNSDIQKFSYEQVEKLFVKKGYQLLNKIYINSHTNMKCVHLQCGEIVEGTYSRLQIGQELCKKCGTLKTIEKLTYSYEYVKSQFQSRGYQLLSNEYNGCYNKLSCKCSKGHVFEISYHDFQRGRRCSICNESQGEIRVTEYLNIYQYI